MAIGNGCKHWDGCNAPLCPMSRPEKLALYIWYHEEEICRRKRGIPDWVRQQRKVHKKLKSENQNYYFTVEMLSVPFRVTEHVKGLDPDKPDEPQTKRWFNKYKGTKKRKLTPEQRERRREAMAKAREAKKQKQARESEDVGGVKTIPTYQDKEHETASLINITEDKTIDE